MQINPHLHWIRHHREKYFDEIVRHEGRTDFRDATCPDCPLNTTETAKPQYRCRDCFLEDMTCQGCCLRRHRRHPFHVIEVNDLLIKS